jgi:hypothetical protein
MSKLSLKENNLFLPIFSDFARFLVSQTTIEVFYVHPRTSEKTKTKLTADNVEEFCVRYDKEIESSVMKGGLFACFGELQKLKIDLNTSNNQINVSQFFEDQRHLYWL